MKHGHRLAIVWCHDTNQIHHKCQYKGVVPVVVNILGKEERLLFKSCMLNDTWCKYQNELQQIPFVPVYIIRE